MAADMSFDINLWGVIVVPIGLLVFFGPALWVAAFGSSDGPNVELRGKPRDVELE